MKAAKMGTVAMVSAFVVVCVVGGLVILWRMNQLEGRVAEEPVTREQARPAGSPLATAAPEARPTSARSVVVNGQRLSDKDIETLARTFQVQVRDGNYWYDRMNGSWGRQGGPTEGFIIAGLNLGGPLREDASNGDTGVFINGRQLHRVDVSRLMQLGPVNPGRCWMDAQGNIGLEGKPAFGNVWAAAFAPGRGGRKEGILSTYDKTGVAVFGY